MRGPLDLRHDFSEQARFFEQAKASGRLSLPQDADQLVTRPLGADLMDPGGHGTNRLPRFRIDHVAQPGSKADSAQNAQLVFFKPLQRVADRSNDPGLDVLAAADIIDHALLGWIVQEAVDREIAPQHILTRIGKRDTDRPPPVDVSLIGAKRGHFERVSPVNHQDDTESSAHGLGTRKYSNDLIGPRARGDVVVRRLEPHHHVADAAADEVGFVTPVAEATNDLSGMGWIHGIGPRQPARNSGRAPPIISCFSGGLGAVFGNG